MTRKGQGEVALGASLVFSVLGGLFGVAVLIAGAPILAEFALNFSSFEYFWMALLGLTCAVFITPQSPLKRSEEHTSELQSLMRISYAVFCLKKKKKHKKQTTTPTSNKQIQ